MSIWQRISTLVKSNINALISSAEDPEKVLNQLITDMREQLVEIKKSVRLPKRSTIMAPATTEIVQLKI